uniref:BZIP domain-containing protein n=1 Tax=Elaeophora elaphi TaxID=1147741 RepID=A0A0R3S058_9BILA
MSSDGNDEECLVEQLRKELRDLAWEEEEAKQTLKKQRYKNEEAEKERDEIKVILEKEEMGIAKKDEELKHFRARVQLRREKIENMRQQILINQMRKAEADEQIEELKKTLEEVKVKEKASHQLLRDRLKAVQTKLLNASWVIARRKEEEELACICKQIDEARAKKERLLQSIQKKEAIFAGNRELPFINFCVAIAAMALKNHALLKRLAREYVTIAQLTEELSNQGILDTSTLSQYSQSQNNQIQPLEEKDESSLCLNNIRSTDANEETEFDCMRGKTAEETIITNFQANGEVHLDFHKEVNSAMTMPAPDDGKLKEDVKLIIIDEEIEKTTSNTTMEVDKSREVSQTSDELEASAARFEEKIIDMSQKHLLTDVNINPSQTSDKGSNIDNNFVSNFIDSSEEVETAASGGSEGENTVDYNDGESESVPGINMKPMHSASDLDPTNFFESFTNFVPSTSAMNLSNTYLGMDTEFDASAIFNLSAMMQNHSGSVPGANDYMALFGGVDTNASSHGNEGFELNFDSLPDENQSKDGIDGIDGNGRFFDF